MQQGRNLAPVVGLVIEKVEQQAGIALGGRNALGVAVVEHMLQVAFRERRDPLDNLRIQPGSVRCQSLQICEQLLIERCWRRQIGHLAQCPPACRVRRKPLQPDGIAGNEVIQGSEHRAEKGTTIPGELLFIKTRRRLVDLRIHPGIVRGQ